jgi:prepilin-type N-terminal cleavage/methylation domain-containing protein
MIKKLKKGFTLVELIVVIAIIAILSTVAVIGYMRVVEKANVSNDTQLVRNLNERMQLYEAENGYKKPTTAHEAFVLTEDFGFIIEKLTPTSSGNDIVWDMTTNRFALISSEDQKVIYSDSTKKLSTNQVDLWKMYKTLPSESEYSIYLAGTTITGDISVGVGVDVGRNANVNINYKNESDPGQNVVIRTNSVDTALTVNGPSDDIKHYGIVGDLTVTAVSSDHCYHEWGFVANLVSFGTGKFVVESTALFHQTKAEVASKFKDETDSYYVEGKDAQYSQHIYNEDGICVVEGCNVHSVEVAPTIKIVEDSEHGYTLVLDEESVENVDWASYKIKLNVPFRFYDYTKESESEEHNLEFVYSIDKDSNITFVPYYYMASFSSEGYGISFDKTANYNIKTNNGSYISVENVGYKLYPEKEGSFLEGSFYSDPPMFAINENDLVNAFYGNPNASKSHGLIMNETDVATYSISVYDSNNNLLGSTEYKPFFVGVNEPLEQYLDEYQSWIASENKEDTRASVNEYLEAYNFEYNGFTVTKIRDKVKNEYGTIESDGVGATGSEQFRSFVLGETAITSTFGRYTITYHNGTRTYAFID